MLLRSLISLLLILGLANTTMAAASTSQVLTSQQVEWYSDVQDGDLTIKAYRLFQTEKVFGQQHHALKFSQANRSVTLLIGVKVKRQNQLHSQQTQSETLRTVISLYPEEDSAS